MEDCFGASGNGLSEILCAAGIDEGSCSGTVLESMIWLGRWEQLAKLLEIERHY